MPAATYSSPGPAFGPGYGPSEARIRSYFPDLDDDAVTLIRALIRGDVNPYGLINDPATAARYGAAGVKVREEITRLSRRWYWEAGGGKRAARVLHCIDVLIDGFGVERFEVRHRCPYSGEPVYYHPRHVGHGVRYVNTGDTYNSTVAYSEATRMFYLCCWGDFVGG